MIISIASGKGGTGKTTIAVNIALSLPSCQFLDCDVEAPNAHIFLKPEIKNWQRVYLPIPKVLEAKCIACGRCVEFCQFNALALVKDKLIVFPELCHSCGGCTIVCPQDAIIEEPKEIGVIEKGHAGGDVYFIGGKLRIGEERAPELISKIKELTDRSSTVILDSPPGTACPMINAVRGSDYCLLVTEPTPFGLNDLKLSVETLRILEIPFGVVINRDGIGDNRVDDYCQQEGIDILLKFPDSRAVAELYSKGISLVEYDPKWKTEFLKLFERIA